MAGGQVKRAGRWHQRVGLTQILGDLPEHVILMERQRLKNLASNYGSGFFIAVAGLSPDLRSE